MWIILPWIILIISSCLDYDKDEHECNAEGRDHKSYHRNSQKDNHLSSSSISRTFRCAKHSTLDLLRPHRDYWYRQSRHYCCHSHDHCHHRCDNEYNRLIKIKLQHKTGLVCIITELCQNGTIYNSFLVISDKIWQKFVGNVKFLFYIHKSACKVHLVIAGKRKTYEIFICYFLHLFYWGFKSSIFKNTRVVNFVISE